MQIGDESNPVRRAQKAQEDLNKLVVETVAIPAFVLRVGMTIL